MWQYSPTMRQYSLCLWQYISPVRHSPNVLPPPLPPAIAIHTHSAAVPVCTCTHASCCPAPLVCRHSCCYLYAAFLLAHVVAMQGFPATGFFCNLCSSSLCKHQHPSSMAMYSNLAFPVSFCHSVALRQCVCSPTASVLPSFATCHRAEFKKSMNIGSAKASGEGGLLESVPRVSSGWLVMGRLVVSRLSWLAPTDKPRGCPIRSSVWESNLLALPANQ